MTSLYFLYYKSQNIQKNTRKMPPNYHLAFRTGVSASQGASLSIYISHHLVPGRLALHTVADLFAFYFSSAAPSMKILKKFCSILVSLDPVPCHFGIATSWSCDRLHRCLYHLSVLCCLARFRELVMS